MAGNFDFNVNANVSNAIAQLEKLGQQFDKLEKKFNIFDKMSGAATALGAALTAAAYEAMSFADEITDLGKANDMTVGSVLALGEALAQNGGKADMAGRMLQSLSNNVDAANSGNLNLATTFGKLGISISDLGRLSNQELRDKLLDNIAKIQDPMERNAKAVEIFGKAMVGVDIRKFAEDQKNNREEMEKYAPALETAGNAWDNLAKMAHEAHIAFTIAFQPVFKFIEQINPGVDSLVTKFRLMGAAFAALTSAGAIQGVLKLAQAFGILNATVGKNPLFKIATLLLSLGAGAAAYFGMTTDANDVAQQSLDIEKDATQVTADRKREQTGLNDAIKKEHDAITQIRENLQKNWQIALDKYDLEMKQLSLNEDQKKVAQEKQKIDEDTKNAIFALDQKYQSMDTATRARKQTTYNEERKLIESNAEAQKSKAEQKLKQLSDYNEMLKRFQAIQTQAAEAEQKMFEAQAKHKIDISNSTDRIDLESKLTAIQKIRSDLMANAAKLSEEEKDKAVQAISESTDNVNLLDESYGKLGESIREAIQLNAKLQGISEESVAKVLSSFDKNFGMITAGAEAVANTNKAIAEQSKTFTVGWNKAFNDYVDNANNAATQANRIFTSFTQSMEDHLMNLFKKGKFGWRDFVQSMIDVLLRSQIQKLMANVMSAGSGGGGGNLMGKIFGFADGGLIPTNGPILVGERGPEIISGMGGRTVTPNDQLGGTSVTYNINAVDASSFKQMLAKDPTFLYAVSEQGRRRIPGSR